MQNQRQNERIDVDLRVTVKLDLKDLPSYPLLGKLENLSASGMRISFPFPVEVLDSNLLNITLSLPKPFDAIYGLGEIQWKRWDKHLNRTICGVKMAGLPQDQIKQINEIIAEVTASDN